MTDKIWQEKKIKEVCISIFDCVNKTAPPVKYPTPYKMIRTTNVRDGYVDTKHVKYVSEETFRAWTRRQAPQKGDILLTREAPLGGIGKLRTDEKVFLGQRLMSYRVDPDKADVDFVLYSFMNNFLGDQIKSLGSGSTVEHMRVGDCGNLIIKIPDLTTQRTIGSTLANYDELILANRKRITLLEQIVHELYKEWFVQFRFPGHKRATIIDSPIGNIPKGWGIEAVSKVVYISPTTPLSGQEKYRFIPMSGVTKDSMLITEYTFRDTRSGTKFKNGDTLFARITPSAEHGKTAFVQLLDEDEVAIGSTEFIVMRSAKLSPHYVYCLARDQRLRSHAIKSMTGASGRQRIQNSCFDSYYIALPPQELLLEFSDAVSSIFKQVDTLYKVNRRLESARRSLLPKLLSGDYTP